QPKPQPKPVPETTKPQPPPAPKFTTGTLEFLYQRNNAEGKTIAILTFTGSDGIPDTLTLGIGDSTPAFRVLSISENAVVIQDASGKKGSIPLNQSRKIAIPK
ncbi:MAG: hypothetical protein IJJ26_06430, partial [Victivallales bacterium]|nr:hypothetical protein [Victivallales bacterium]